MNIDTVVYIIIFVVLLGFIGEAFLFEKMLKYINKLYEKQPSYNIIIGVFIALLVRFIGSWITSIFLPLYMILTGLFSNFNIAFQYYVSLKLVAFCLFIKPFIIYILILGIILSFLLPLIKRVSLTRFMITIIYFLFIITNIYFVSKSSAEDFQYVDINRYNTKETIKINTRDLNTLFSIERNVDLVDVYYSYGGSPMTIFKYRELPSNLIDEYTSLLLSQKFNKPTSFACYYSDFNAICIDSYRGYTYVSYAAYNPNEYSNKNN